MKQVKLNQITLVNFRGHRSLKVEFSEQTIISGDNGKGKSGIYDAFLWLLFGKDQFDRKDFEIIPTIDGKQLDRVDPEVSATINVDGRTMTLKRVLHQKWVRRRGTAEEVFDGCETLYYFNDVPLKAAEYKARVDLIVEESVFKMITNTAAFLSLHWTKQREILFQIAGTASDEQIAASDPRFAAIMEMLTGKSMVEFKKELAARKKKLKSDLENIQPRIDQTTRLMPAEQAWKELETRIDLINKEIAQIDEILADSAKANRAQYEAIQEKQGEINVLKNKSMAILNNAKAQAQQEAFEANQHNTAIQNSVAGLLRVLKQSEAEFDSAYDQTENLKYRLTADKKRLEQLRSDWDAENTKEYQAKSGCLICPAFGHECADTAALKKHEQQADRAKESFIEAQRAKLDKISAEGTALKEAIEHLKSRIADAEKYLDEARGNVKKQEIAYEEAKKSSANIIFAQPREIIASELPEHQECTAKIEAINTEIAKLSETKQDNSGFSSKKSELASQRDQLMKQLSDRETITRYKAEVKKLEYEGANIAQQIADIEGTEFIMDDFTKAKVSEADRRINSMFEIVKFKLYDRTNEGNEFEACIPTNQHGVLLSVTNTAEMVNAGLDIIRKLSEFYNVSAPIFTDRAESVNEFINTGSQMIFLRVTREKQLTITNV